MVLAISSVIAVIFFLWVANSKKSVLKVKNSLPVKGFYSLNENITLKTKLNLAEITITTEGLHVKGLEKLIAIKFSEISELKLHKIYSNNLGAAVIELRFKDEFLLFAALSFSLFNNFVVGKRMVTLAMYELLLNRINKNDQKLA